MDLIHIFEYDEWATNELLDAVEKLDYAAFHKDLGTSFQSVHGTLLHILRGQIVWFTRWSGSSMAIIKPEDAPTAAGLRQRWRELYRDLHAYLRSLTSDRLESNLTYRDPTGKEWSHPLYQQIEHLALHSMFHRGQVVALLRQLGQTPPHTDLIVYYRMQMAQSAGSNG